MHYRRGERACCEEIKEFVQKYNIRQQQIATLSGTFMYCTCYFVQVTTFANLQDKYMYQTTIDSTLIV